MSQKTINDLSDRVSALTAQLRYSIAENTLERERVSALTADVARLESTLERFAIGKRSDGTYNLSREAVEQMAKEALRG